MWASIYTTPQITYYPRGVCTGGTGEPPFGVWASGPSSQSLRSGEGTLHFIVLCVALESLLGLEPWVWRVQGRGSPWYPPTLPAQGKVPDVDGAAP